MLSSNPREPPLMLAHDLRLEGPVPVSRHLYRQRPKCPLDRFRRIAVPRITAAIPRSLLLLIPHVLRHLSRYRTLQKALRQLPQQPVLPNQVLRLLVPL